MKKAAILYSKYTPLIDAIKYQLSDCEVELKTDAKNLEEYDLVILTDFNGKYQGKTIACHHSLLPSFSGDEPAKQAILAGVKLTGITIYLQNPFKIIAQYPIYINNNTHFDELEQELVYAEQAIFPIVIKKVLQGETFELSEIITKNGCSKNCGGCSSCNH